ncbi:DNA/RNA nuclease SfsA [Paenibacillus sinopodophylli]|uniref:DNA/RNA nuclease SfsA n=1 Tax=Paenibacillus sinopodophylli TaxID=1837342 RepID=UPI00110D165F|nr:DNA/RNA nuclease SfsA [Paenibacillus sinopodophylli]
MKNSSKNFIFTTPLIEGVIQKKKNRFIMIVEIDGILHDCHCPTTGNIGNIVFRNIPCLVSTSNDPKRKTKFTIEAISVDLPRETSKAWIGINQNAANRYVEHFLTNGQLQRMVGNFQSLVRETTIGNSKLDFRVDNTYIEVKTPLTQLQVEIKDHIEVKKNSEFNSFERFIKHIGELGSSLSDNDRAIMIVCLIYENPGFKVGMANKQSNQIMHLIQDSIKNGFEIWQVNFKITPTEVSLSEYTNITTQFTTGEIIAKST